MEQARHHIGILAHSAEGASLCYRTAWLEGIRLLGPHDHPEITLTGKPMAAALEAWERGDLAKLRAFFVDDADKLKRAGADFFVLPDNSAHIALEAPGPDFPLPCLHIAEVVAGEAVTRGFAKVAILGTKWTMEGPVYRSALERRGLAWAVPGESDQAEIHRIIMDELCLGEIREVSREFFHAVIDGMRDAECDSAALVCTEIPLIVEPDRAALPVLDSTRLLAHAAVAAALGRAPFPKWRGGPVG